MINNIIIPDLGAVPSARIIDILVNVGDSIEKETPLITLEGEKASVDIPSPFKGVITKIVCKVDDMVSAGDKIIELEMENEEKKTTTQPESTKSKLELITIPDLGVSSAVNVIDISVKMDDYIKQGDTLITLEGEKASVDIPAPKAGKIKNILLQIGDQVKTNDNILELEVSETEEAKKDTSHGCSIATHLVSESIGSVKEQDQTMIQHDLYISPAVRKISREFGVDLTKIMPTGRKGRITVEDVQKYVKSKLQEGTGSLSIFDITQYDFSKFGEIETKNLSRIKQASGKHLHKTWITVPHITHFDEVDITELEEFRQQKKKENIRITPLVFIIKAAIKCLQEFPMFNSSLDFTNKQLIYKKYYHIGIAVSTEQGLVVPVIKNADQKNIFQLSEELIAISTKARENKLTQQDIQGQSFTISSLGSLGGKGFTPIVNFPDVAILGISKMDIKPIYTNKQFIPRKILPFCVSYDHRVIDGAETAKFCQKLAEYLLNFSKFL